MCVFLVSADEPIGLQIILLRRCWRNATHFV